MKRSKTKPMKTKIKEIIERLKSEPEACYGCNAPSGRIQLYDKQGERLASCRNIHEARRVAKWNGFRLVEK